MKGNVPERWQSFHVTEAYVPVADVAQSASLVAAMGDRGAGITDLGYSSRLHLFI